MCVGWLYGFVFFFFFGGILKTTNDKCELFSAEFKIFHKMNWGEGVLLKGAQRLNVEGMRNWANLGQSQLSPIENDLWLNKQVQVTIMVESYLQCILIIFHQLSFSWILKKIEKSIINIKLLYSLGVKRPGKSKWLRLTTQNNVLAGANTQIYEPRVQDPVAHRADNAIKRINRYSVDKC